MASETGEAVSALAIATNTLPHQLLLLPDSILYFDMAMWNKGNQMIKEASEEYNNDYGQNINNESRIKNEIHKIMREAKNG